MTAAQHKPTAFIFLVALALAVVSVPSEALSADGGQIGSDACCAQGEEPSTDATECDTSVPLDEDCCPNGCEDCFLTCCYGPVSLRTPSGILELTQDSTGSVPPSGDDFSVTRPKEIYHPPRF